jgi:hypothetical protein
VPLEDLTAEVFLVLRDAFFDRHGVARPFPLRSKHNTQADPLDEHIATLLTAQLAGAVCQKASGPLISPDMVVYHPDACLVWEPTVTA